MCVCVCIYLCMVQLTVVSAGGGWSRLNCAKETLLRHYNFRCSRCSDPPIRQVHKPERRLQGKHLVNRLDSALGRHILCSLKIGILPFDMLMIIGLLLSLLYVCWFLKDSKEKARQNERLLSQCLSFAPQLLLFSYDVLALVAIFIFIYIYLYIYIYIFLIALNVSILRKY